MSDDQLAAALDEERAILAAAADAADHGQWRIAAQFYGTLKVSALLAAVERAQELADRWEQEAGRLQHVAREQAARGTGAGRRGTTGGLAVAHIDCAKALRGAITTELAKGEAGDGS